MTKAKIVSSALAATTALLSVAPLAFASDVGIVGNGAESQNTANVNLNRTVTIQQQSTADVSNKIAADANSGNNEANKNTGGDVAIKTGDATTKVAVANQSNSNTTSLDCCDPISLSARIAGNGASSDNDINFNLNDEKNFYETNELNIRNRFYLSANTGDNEANGNTGGDVEISTGDALIELVLTNKGNSNTVDCACGQKEEELPPLPGTIPAIPAAVPPSGTTLPMTGFDLKLAAALAAMISGAGIALKTGSGKLEGLFG